MLFCIFLVGGCAPMQRFTHTGYAITHEGVTHERGRVVTPDGQVETDLTRVAGNMVLLDELPNNHRLYYIVQDDNKRILTRWQWTQWFLGQPFGKIVHKTILMERVRDGWILVDLIGPDTPHPTPVARSHVFPTEREAFLTGKKELYFLQTNTRGE